MTAEHFHFSGVLAVVSGGLFVSFRSHEIFPYNSRLQLYSFWDTLVFILNGLVFILIGLQLPHVVKGLGRYALADAIFYGIVISLVTIVIRIIWVFPSAYLPRLLSKRIRKREERPTWKAVFIVAWSGMRGVVSLASALAVPTILVGETAFPHRNLILFITFTVILFTLVLQGLSLPFVVRLLKVETHEHLAEQEQDIRLRMATVSLNHIRSAYAEESSNIEAFNRVRGRYERMIEQANQKLAEQSTEKKSVAFLPKYRNMLLELVDVRRKELSKLRKDKKYDEELLRKKELELDLEEARLKSS